MLDDSDAHPDWDRVIRALVDGAIMKEANPKVLRQSPEETDLGEAIEVLTSRMSDSAKNKFLAKKNKEGKTLLHLAFENHHPNAAAALIRSGADALAEADDRQRSNLFHLAAENGDTAGRLITVAQNKPNIS